MLTIEIKQAPGSGLRAVVPQVDLGRLTLNVEG